MCIAILPVDSKAGKTDVIYVPLLLVVLIAILPLSTDPGTRIRYKTSGTGIRGLVCVVPVGGGTVTTV